MLGPIGETRVNAEMSLSANIERFSGFADLYDDCRPQPPSILLDILTRIADIGRPRLVVDLGSGTGLSTRCWAERADCVIGIEPNSDMRTRAQTRSMAQSPNVCYVAAFASETGLKSGSADIVTCAQSLHWMEPQPTLTEIARILRPRGVFAAYDCDWPPTVGWQAERAFNECLLEAERIGKARGWSRAVKWEKGCHQSRMQASGLFQYVEENVVHSVETGNAERFVGLATSQGSVAQLLKHGLSEKEIGLDHLRATAVRTIGDQPRCFYFHYRVRLGIK